MSPEEAVRALRDDARAELSVVIPVHNEAGNVQALAEEIERALVSLARWECVWVDDGSTDGSWQILRELTARPHHRLLRFPDRRGQSAAMLAGFAAARYEFVGSLDADGQNDPADLPRLLWVCLRDSVDLATGYRASREDSWSRKVSSRLANWARGRLIRDGVRDTGCSTRVGRRIWFASLPRFNGAHRFIPAMIKLRGGRISEIPVNHRGRRHGTSKYGVHNRLWRGIADIFGVRWLLSRAIDVRASEVGSEGGSSSPGAGVDAPERARTETGASAK